MKIILLSARSLEYYTPELFNLFDITLVCTSKQVAQIPTTIQPFFNQIAIVAEKFNPITLVMELDEQSVIEIAAKIVAEKGASNVKVSCSQEANLELAAHLRERFELSGMDSANLLGFRDKVIMKQRLIRNNIRVPHFIEAVDFQYPAESLYKLFKEELGELLIIKPRNSVGSRGIYKVFSLADFLTFYAHCKDDSCTYEVEEFIEGTLYHCDFALQKKQFYFEAASEYTWPNADFQMGKNLGSIPLLPNNPLSKRIIDFGKKTLNAFDLPDGCFHLELFISSLDEMIFLEVGARPPGLFSVPVYQKTFGINLYDIDFLIQIGEDVNKWLKHHQIKEYTPASFIAFPKLNGTVSKLVHPSLQSQFSLEWLVKEGDIIKRTSTNVDFAGHIVYWNKNYDKLRSDFEYFKNKFKSIEYA